MSFFLVDQESLEESCKISHSMVFQHKIEGLIIGVGLSNNKENMALALAMHDENGKGRVHNYYIRIYETFSKSLDVSIEKEKSSFLKNSILGEKIHENSEELMNFTDIYLGNGNVVLTMTLEENLVVFFRMFDDVLFNTLIK